MDEDARFRRVPVVVTEHPGHPVAPDDQVLGRHRGGHRKLIDVASEDKEGTFLRRRNVTGVYGRPRTAT